MDYRFGRGCFDWRLESPDPPNSRRASYPDGAFGVYVQQAKSLKRKIQNNNPKVEILLNFTLLFLALRFEFLVYIFRYLATAIPLEIAPITIPKNT